MYLKAEDEGWGVQLVRLEYETDSLKSTIEAREAGPGYYRVELPPLNATQVRVTAVAVDFAGNSASDTLEIEYAQPPKPAEEQAGQQPSQQQPSQQVEQPTPQAPAQQPPSYAIVLAVVMIVAIAAIAAVVISKRTARRK